MLLACPVHPCRARHGPAGAHPRHRDRHCPAHHPRADGADVRLRHHALRRHPPRPRRDLRDLRPARAGAARRRSRRASTSRTSPTSTTRCSSAPSATAWTGRDLATAEIALFREDMTALAVIAAGPLHRRGRESIPLIVGGGRGSSSANGHRLPASDAPGGGRGRLYFDVDRAAAVRRGLAPRPRARCSRCSPSGAATPTARASATPSTRCCGGPRRDGRAVVGRRRRSATGRPGWHIECATHRPAPPRACRSTCRAAAPTSSSRTTR